MVDQVTPPTNNSLEADAYCPTGEIAIGGGGYASMGMLQTMPLMQNDTAIGWFTVALTTGGQIESRAICVTAP